MAEKSPTGSTARHEGDRKPLMSPDELAEHLEEILNGTMQAKKSEVEHENQAVAANSNEGAAQDDEECMDSNETASSNPLYKYRKLRAALKKQIPKKPEVTVRFYRVRIYHDVNPNLTSVASFPDGRILLTDFCCSLSSGFVTLFNPEKQLRIEHRLPSPSYCSTPIDNKHVAVSLPREKIIRIMEVGLESWNIRTVVSHKFEFKPWVIIGLENGNLAVGWSDPFGFSIVDISGERAVHRIYLTKDKHGRVFQSFGHFAVDEGRRHVIQPCAREYAVFCFDFEGTPVFRYEAENMLCPEGVTLDTSGNIYVCEFRNDAIHKISAAGEPIVVFSENIPHRPRAICLDHYGTGFWMTYIKPESGYTVAHLTLKY